MEGRSFERRPGGRPGSGSSSSGGGRRSERFGDKDGGDRRGPRYIRTRPGIPKGTKIEYKNIAFLQKFITERGKITSRRYSSITAKEMRQLTMAIKQARFLGLLSVGSSKRK